MFEILRKSLATGIVTTDYPQSPAAVSSGARGRPEIDSTDWKDARLAIAACPTGALSATDGDAIRTVSLDLGKCTFCGLCAEADASIRMTNACELATRRRQDLIATAEYALNPDGSHTKLVANVSKHGAQANSSSAPPLDALGSELERCIHKVLGRSLHIREVDAGSCNGCEIEIAGLNSPVYDIERFGIHFVASPRHADMLLVTGPVSRNMELALRKTYEATPAPRLVVAVGACGCSGGIFGQSYASLGGVDKVIPVDVYIPGCPPNPHALLHGILTALGRL
ncbi:MAG TPA: NADH-quinone oxidoreductase subunit NuoB [Candidatus Binatia bacterium]|jgi:Ni,Fe-hydrogenase III small subunit/formate hydrogenlyase subunit 6/NADH:ubiquinone oxidoreductase subunit I|nr:NADH-quinone oxidoreductase subunit NuoB [Candidatus Binatia bacterium]